ncbi:ATP-binding protein [Silvimonas soli]|uniref:ATP-binding protein n=1 Tax=Silvimonas soli TaxID=2980100 RepID=UPI0024B372E1|nr:transporter substrate-binding domain-containing protein [Silvimonas soli]
MRLLAAYLMALAVALAANQALSVPLATTTAAAPQTNSVLQNKGWKEGVLRIGVIPDQQPPLEIQDAPGHFIGVSVDVIEAIAKKNGLSPTYRAFANVDELRTRLALGQIDVASSIPRTRDVTNISFGLPYYAGRLVIVKRRNSDLVNQTPIRKLAYVSTQDVLGDLKQHVPAQSYLPFSSDLQAIQAVAFGSADAGVGNYVVVSWLIKQLQLRNLEISNFAGFSSDGFYLATRADDTRLRHLLDSGIATMDAATRQNIQSRWENRDIPFSTDTQITFNQAELSWIKANPIVRYATIKEFAPFFFLTPDDKPAGISVDLLDKIHKQTGQQFEAVLLDSAGQIPDVMRSAKASLTLFSPSDLAADFMDQSYPYATSLWVMVGRSGAQSSSVSQPANQRVGIIGGQLIYNAVAPHFQPGQLTLFATPRALFDAVKLSRIDVAITDIAVANYLIGEFYKDQLVIQGTLAPLPKHFGFGVTKQAPELLSIVNKVILTLPPDYMETWESRWLSEAHPDPTWQRYRAQIAGGLALAIALAIIALGWGWTLRRQVRLRKAANTALSANLALNKALFNSIPVPIFVCDTQGALQSANRTYLASTQQEMSHIQSQLVQQLPVTREPDVQQLLFDPAHRPEDMSDVEVSLNGHLHNLYVWATSFEDGKGHKAGYAGGWLDVTARIELENQLRAARDEAAQANQIKSLFLAGMSHEVRTPLSAVIGILDLRLDAAKDPTDSAQLLAARGSASHLLALVDEVLDLSRIESETLVLHPAPVNLAALAAELREVFTLQANNKGLEFVCTEQNTACEVSIDLVRLRQIITNLITNALKFTNQGRVTLTLQLTTQNDNPQLHIAVSDTGIGIAQKDQPMLFEPFYRAPTEGPQIYEGTGLGLALTHRLVQVMQGTLTLHSVLRQGTTFEVCLPVAVIGPTQAAAVMANKPREIWFPGLAVLIVDDHPVNRLILRGQLEKLGCHVDEAADGFAALDMLKRRDYGLVVIDCTMPLMSGPQLAKAIRSVEPAEQHRPLIGMTASLQKELHEQALSAGMNSCQIRPVSIQTWSKLLNEYCWDYCDLRPDFTQSGENTAESIKIKQTLTSSLASDLLNARELMATRQFSALADVIHRIKGPFSMLARQELVAACAAVESACTDPDERGNIPNLLRRLERMCAEYMDNQ